MNYRYNPGALETAMPAPATTAAASQRRRLWPRFTLRLLLVTITAVCIGLAIWTHRAREQRRVVGLINQSNNAVVLYNHQFLNGRRQIDSTGELKKSDIPEFLISQLGIDFFYQVSFVHVSDPALIKELPSLPSLQHLMLSNESLTDEDVVQIQHLHGLETLSIQGNEESPFILTGITDETLAIIGRLPHIKKVHLEGNGFTTDGLKSLAQAQCLESVFVSGCKNDVDRKALGAFEQCTGLKALDVYIGKPFARRLAEVKPASRSE